MWVWVGVCVGVGVSDVADHAACMYLYVCCVAVNLSVLVDLEMVYIG